MARYYIDTCIWRDFAEKRTDARRDLGSFARAFFHKVVEEKHTILWSDAIDRELVNVPSLKDIRRVRQELLRNGCLQVIRATTDQLKEA